MPIYEFECDGDCEANLRFEKEFKINEEHTYTCPVCHSKMRKIYSAPNVHFKGSGFYSTDN